MMLDPLGNFFFLPSLVCLLLALQWGGTTYAWSDGKVIALLVLFAVLFIAFILVQIFKQSTAMVPAHIIKNRSILAAMWYTFCLASGMMLMVYYIPVWFQAIKGVSAVKSGIDTIPLVLSLVLGTIISGQITGRIGYYTPFAYASVVVMSIGAGMISTWTVSTGHSMWIGYQVLYGFGLGIGMQQGNMAAQTVLNRKDVPMGISLVMLTQMLGGAIFISVGQNILDKNLVEGITKLVPCIDPRMIVNTGATALRNLVSPDKLPEILVVYNYAIRQTFLIAVGMSVAAAVGAFALEWKSVKGPKESRATKVEEAKTTDASEKV
jgi:MFS family permease